MVEKSYMNLEKILSIAIMSPFVILTVQYFALANSIRLGIDVSFIIQLFSKILVGLILFYALYLLIKHEKLTFILVYLISSAIFLSHYAIFLENRVYIQNLIFPFFFMCLPLFLISLKIRDFETFKNIMFKASAIIYIFGITLSIEDILGIVDIGTYSGPLSNYLLIPTIVFIEKFIDKGHIKCLILSIVSIFFILVLGSRGAILCILFFIAIKFIFLNSKNKAHNIIIKTLVGLFISFILLNYRSMLNMIYIMLSDFGIKSRTIQLFLKEDIYLSGRENLYSKLIDYILNNPILGFGIAGDRKILSGEAVYAHNIFIEVIGNFGLFLGLLMVIVFITLVLYSLFNIKGEKKKILIIWLSIGFIHLFISSSYLIEMKFWILFGFMINILFIKQCKSYEIEESNGVS
ncbi:O-antigen ligase family protein [Staphylococcus equorum]|uniref:O-antigen ligase family protein n=1 Tax=Staphylococcus equorum TaxID=246432 RepID=UPI0008FD1AAE|nr:hypothetical protein BFN02_05065 [Staphylococcus equorum]